MSFSKNIKVLKSIYENAGIARSFKKDSKYLKDAYNDIHKFWLHNFKAIDKVNYEIVDYIRYAKKRILFVRLSDIW